MFLIIRKVPVTGGALGGGGYGGGAGATSLRGGDGTVLIRYWAYEE